MKTLKKSGCEQNVSMYWMTGDPRGDSWLWECFTGCCVTLELRRRCWGWLSGRDASFRTTPLLERPLDYPFQRGSEGIAIPLKSCESRSGWRRLFSSAFIVDARGKFVRGMLDSAMIGPRTPFTPPRGVSHSQDRHNLRSFCSDFSIKGLRAVRFFEKANCFFLHFN